MEKLIALLSILDQLVAFHRLHEIIRMQQGQADVVEKVLQHDSAVVHVKVHPTHHGLKNHFLLTDHYLVTGDVLFQLFLAQVQEFLVLGNVGEALERVRAATAGELLEGVCVCEALDAQAVAGVKLVFQKLGAGVAQGPDLEEAGGLEEKLNVLRGDAGTSGVDVLQEGVHGLGADAVDLYEHLAALPVVVAEHGAEVSAAGRQHGAVTRELATFHADHHVGEHTPVTELVEHLKDAL